MSDITNIQMHQRISLPAVHNSSHRYIAYKKHNPSDFNNYASNNNLMVCARVSGRSATVHVVVVCLVNGCNI